MQDRSVVAAVIAGDADGFGAACDQYAASLYARCRAVLPEPEAADAVLDTFLVAAAKLDGLRDPERLGPWLHAVARNECLRRLGPGREIPVPADEGAEPPELPLPPDFRSRVLTACADNSPAGRAHRMSVAHRAGVFGPAGFPKAIGPSGPPWWRRVRRHRGVVATAALVAALAVTAGLTVVMAADASHRPQAAGPGLGGGVPAPASGATPGGTSRAPSPARTAPTSAWPTSPTSLASPASLVSPASPAAVPPGATSAGPSPSTSSPAASPSPTSPSPSTSPAQGYLVVAPARLVLTSVSGKPVSGSFVLTARAGPVSHYAVVVAAMAARVKVAPAAGSLRANGSVTVTVTVTSKVALTTYVIVAPGDPTVTVVYKLKPSPSPSA